MKKRAPASGAKDVTREVVLSRFVISHAPGGAPLRGFILCRYKLGTETIRHQIGEMPALTGDVYAARYGYSP